MKSRHKLAAIAGFVVLGLSPSFIDWKQSPDDRGKMVVFYVAGVGLIWYGVSL